jgi:hypothetical protein
VDNLWKTQFCEKPTLTGKISPMHLERLSQILPPDHDHAFYRPHSDSGIEFFRHEPHQLFQLTVEKVDGQFEKIRELLASWNMEVYLNPKIHLPCIIQRTEDRKTSILFQPDRYCTNLELSLILNKMGLKIKQTLQKPSTHYRTPDPLPTNDYSYIYDGQFYPEITEFMSAASPEVARLNSEAARKYLDSKHIIVSLHRSPSGITNITVHKEGWSVHVPLELRHPKFHFSQYSSLGQKSFDQPNFYIIGSNPFTSENLFDKPARQCFKIDEEGVTKIGQFPDQINLAFSPFSHL